MGAGKRADEGGPSRPPSWASLRGRGPLAALLRRARRVLSRPQGPRARLVFHAGYAPPDSAVADARRASKILDHLIDEGWIFPGEVILPPPLDLAALRRVHDDAYLASLDAPAAVARALGGVDPPPTRIAAGYLRAQRWATAGTVHATRLSLARGGLFVNVGGGFHHAERARGGGFCLFHDVAVALEDARLRGFSGRVLVMDLDLHHGDGTRRIFRDDPAVTAASIHASSWDDAPAPHAIDLALGTGVGDATYLDAVRDVLDRAARAGEPDLVFYVAGVDVAIDDALGSWRVSADAIAARDRLVLSRFRDKPCVMVLAGGYGADAWRHSARTLVWALSGHDVPIPTTQDVALRRFRRVARSFGAEELTGHTGPDGRRPDGPGADDFGITEADILGDLVDKRPQESLLGFYTAYGMEMVFERYGLFDLLRRRGYPRLSVELNPQSGSGEAVTVRTDDARRLVLVELVVREMREVVPYRLLSVEWLLLQDPLGLATPVRPLLPGQERPGLGAMRLMMGILSMAAERLHFDGLTFVPAHYHTAAQARAILRFLDPRDEAVFAAIREPLCGCSLAEASRLVAEGRLRDETTGAPFAWRPARMVIPASDALRDAVTGPDYDRRVEEAARALHLRLSPPASPA